MSDDPKPQSDKFIEAARKAECDEDEGRWNERLRKVLVHRRDGEEKAGD